MTKPVTPQDMFDMWQKMVNPGAYPLQSLMFPVLDPRELEKKIGELEVVEHWLRANLSMLQLTVKSLQMQRAMLKGGEKFREKMAEQRGQSPEAPAAPAGENPAMWAWNMMANAGKAAAASPAPSRKKRRKKS
ncbi:MAG TPA: PhaM family polyhydroxyalkanoate granule multifunctional regulatory protein [Usitatibacter sp.]|nr:PhaM family polyhydroxyalkanoate granule multifunctional regulatory protein [Usitatibacter sp.]